MLHLERVYKELYFESSKLEFQIIIRNGIVGGAFVVDEFQWNVGVSVQECFILIGFDQFRIVFYLTFLINENYPIFFTFEIKM